MATYYINADTGVNSGAGGSGAPWLTIAYAYTNSTTGDTIFCQNSTATFSWVNQTFTTARIITGQSAAGVVFDGAAGDVSWGIAGSLTVSNVTFQNAVPTGVYRAEFHLTVNTASATFTNCVFNTLSGNTSGYGVFGADAASPAPALSLTGCLFNGLVAGAVFRQVTLTMTSCTFYANWTAGQPIIKLLTSCGTSTIVNSIFALAGLNLSTSFSDSTVTATYSDLYNISTTGLTVGTGCITTNPLFVDAPNANFNLRPTSPCIDSGSII